MFDLGWPSSLHLEKHPRGHRLTAKKRKEFVERCQKKKVKNKTKQNLHLEK